MICKLDVISAKGGSCTEAIISRDHSLNPVAVHLGFTGHCVFYTIIPKHGTGLNNDDRLGDRNQERALGQGEKVSS